jgi:hypothetical protein
VIGDDPDYWDTYSEDLRRRLREIDELDDQYVPALPPLPRGYRTEFEKTNQGWYWHLYRYDKRVNGGLSATRDDAGEAALSATSAHLCATY